MLVVSVTVLAEKCGSKTIRQKSNGVTHNTLSVQQKIKVMKIVKHIKCLEMMFRTALRNNISTIEETRKFPNTCSIKYSVTSQTYNRLLIGKSHWKGLALPTLH